MIRKQDLLDSVRIASPCHAAWEEMKGDDQIRHCADCKLNVFNISDMSRSEAVKLIQEREGRLCIRMFRRIDGTVITRDCPKGVWALRRKAAMTFAYAAGLVFAIFALTSNESRAIGGLTRFATQFNDPAWRTSLPNGVRSVLRWIDPTADPDGPKGGMGTPVTGKVPVAPLMGMLATQATIEIKGDVALPVRTRRER